MDLVFLPRNLAKLAAFCAGEEGRYAMMGVRVTLKPGYYRCEATNGKFVATVKGPSAPPPDKGREVAMRDRATAFSSNIPQAILDKKDWLEALRGGKKDLGAVGLCLSSTALATFVHGTGTLHCTPLEGRFPDISQCVPRIHPGSISFALRPEYLLPIAELSRALDIETLEVIYYAPGLPIGFTGTNEQGQVLDVLLMPVALPAPYAVQTAS